MTYCRSSNEQSYMPNFFQEREAALEQALTPEARLIALNSLSEDLCEVDPLRALRLAEEAHALALTLNDAESAVVALLNRAWAEFNQADYSSSIMNVQEGLRQARKHHFDQQEFDALTILGNAYNVIGNRADALQAFTQALTISKKLPNPRRVAIALSNIGQQYAGIGDYQQALDHYLQGLEIMRSSSNRIALVNVMLNVTENYNKLGQHEQAIAYARESLAIAQTEHYKVGEAIALLNTANAYRSMGDATSAMSYYEQALADIRLGNAPLYEGRIQRDSAIFLLEQGNTSRALTYLLNALAIFQTLDVKAEIFAVHQQLAYVYQQMGDFASAFYQLEQFLKIKDQVFNEQADNRQKTLQALYEVEKARSEAQTQFNRNLTLQQEIQQSEQIIAELDAYADNVAHDLRNPIGVIVGFGGLMEMNLEETLDAENLGYLTGMLAAADKMNEIVEALLTLARARKEKILPQVVDMNQVLSEALSRLQPLMTQQHAEVEVQGTLPPAMGNEAWLEEAFVNYISNAIKYGGKQPCVTIGSTVQDDGFIRYWVQDNGKGLDEDAKQLLFKKFERLGQHKIDGHGLGLSIVKAIVEKLGGAVQIESSGVVDEGSIFSFTLSPPHDS